MRNIISLTSTLFLAFILISCGNKEEDPQPVQSQTTNNGSNTGNGNSTTNNTSTFSPVTLRTFCSSGGVGLPENNVISDFQVSTDSVNYTSKGNTAAYMRTNTGVCAENSMGLPFGIQKTGKYFIKVITRSATTSSTKVYNNTLTHVATLTVKSDGSMVLVNFQQISNHRIAFTQCSGGYRVTVHYPNSLFKD